MGDIRNHSGPNVRFPDHINKISEVSKDILRKMLVANPDERISWEQIMQHKALYGVEDRLFKNISEYPIYKEKQHFMNDHVNCFAMTPDSKHAVHVSEFGYMGYHSLENQSQIYLEHITNDDIHNRMLKAVAVTTIKGTNYAFLGGADKHIYQWNLDGKKMEKDWGETESDILCIAISNSREL